MERSNFFNNLPKLETERLTLRKFDYKDVLDVFEYTSDPKVTKYLSWNSHISKDEAFEFLNIVTENYIKGIPSPWAIVLKSTKQVIGSIGIIHWDPFFNRVEIGFILKTSFWNMGYVSESIYGVLKYCFKSLQINRIEATCELGNKASSHLLEKVGMAYEGTLRQYGSNNGMPVDMMMFSILKSEWDKKLY